MCLRCGSLRVVESPMLKILAKSPDAQLAGYRKMTIRYHWKLDQVYSKCKVMVAAGLRSIALFCREEF